MAKPNKPTPQPQQPAAATPRPQRNSPVATAAPKREEKPSVFGKRNEELVFGKTNFTWLLGGVGLVLAGLLMMTGGEQPNSNEWDPNIIYSTRITAIAPMMILGGLVVVGLSLFKKK